MFGFMQTPQPFEDDFQEWWSHCPRKVGKLAAQKEYIKVRRRGVTQAALLDGLERYKATKPSYQDWCHPRTFLAQGRWMDEVEAPTPKGALKYGPCEHTPRCNRTWNHVKLLQAEAGGDAAEIALCRRMAAPVPSDGNGRP